MVFPIVSQTFVEVGVVLFSDILWFSHPDGFGFVELLEFSGNFFYFLFLFILLFVLFDFNVIILLFLFLLII
jgi:hypothetical protein